MIPKEHLRIGNLVMYEQTYHVVKELHGSIVLHVWQDADRHYGLYETIEPIPLTEDWLEQFGFFSKYKSVHMRWNILGFDINQKSDEDDEGGKIPQEQVFYYYPSNLEVKWVHQLQNLYFSVMGEELKLKDGTPT